MRNRLNFRFPLSEKFSHFATIFVAVFTGLDGRRETVDADADRCKWIQWPVKKPHENNFIHDSFTRVRNRLKCLRQLSKPRFEGELF